MPVKIYEVVDCVGRTCLTLLSKETISLLVEQEPEDGLKFIADQIALSKSIAESYWRPLIAPDIFWDDDLLRPMIWREAKPGDHRPVGARFWPLWTIEDCLEWMKKEGHALVSTYYFRAGPSYETYFTHGIHDKLVRIDAPSLIAALLTFIDRSIKGEYRET